MNIECLKAFRSISGFLDLIKDEINKSGSAHFHTNDIIKEMGPSFKNENELDIFLCLRNQLYYEEGLIVEKLRDKKLQSVYVFKNPMECDSAPPLIREIDDKEIIPHTNDILKIIYDRDTKPIIKVIEMHKDIITNVSIVESNSESNTVSLKLINLELIKSKDILDLITEMDSDAVEFIKENNSIDFNYIDKEEREKLIFMLREMECENFKLQDKIDKWKDKLDDSKK